MLRHLACQEPGCHNRLLARAGACFAAALWLAAWVAMTRPVAAEDAAAARRPLFREADAIQVSLDNSVRVVAVEYIDQDQKRHLTYNYKFPGPEIRVAPNETLKINLFNSLPQLTEADLLNFSPAVLRADEKKELKDFMVAVSGITNLHTHGLHVSPQGRSDNVLLKINRSKQNTYTYVLPPDHAPGTHWYHAHLHGSTALQVQGGMAGALIVTEPTGQSLNPRGYQVLERVLVLQFGDGGAINPQPEGEQRARSQTEAVGSTELSAQERGLIEVQSEKGLRDFVNGLDDDDLQRLMGSLSELRTRIPPLMVNGLENPVAQVQQDVEVQRLRIINAGSRRRDYKKLWITDHKMYLAAIDGVNLRELPKDAKGEYVAYDQENPLVLAPGNRADVFFVPTTAGTFSLMMEGDVGVEAKSGPAARGLAVAAEEVARQKFTRRLMTFEVGGPDLATARTGTANFGVEPQAFLKDLDANLRRLQATDPYRKGYLRPFTAEPTVQRKMVFDIGPSRELAPPPNGRRQRTFLINGRDYNEMIDGEMRGHSDYLGKAPEDGGRGPNGESPWPLRSGQDEAWKIVNASGAPHPFHIHVSPFWVYDIEENRGGKIVSLRKLNPNDPLLNRWQDTISLPENGGSVTIWHRVSDLVGLYVVHCHILQHEDRGMMINILTVPSNERNPQRYFEQQMEQNDRLNREINM